MLVTGATGRVGSRFVPWLLQQGREVRVLARDAAKAQPLADLGADVVVGDLRDAAAVDKSVAGAAAVIHLGAVFRGVQAEEMRVVNEVATVDLARAAQRAGVPRFVYVGTTLAYGAGHGRPNVESDELRPGPRAYAASKAAAEQALTALLREEGLPLRIGRLCFVYGAGDPHLAESLNWARKWPLHQRLHLVHHVDVSQALLRLAEADGIDGKIYNIGDDAPITAWELLQVNNETPAEDAATWVLEDPWDGIADTSAIRRDLGFRPIYPTLYSARDAGAL
ncbi:NAD-dependent epimerase/dehydratase family protein [Dactylosporangium sp. CA-139114]|uniref:NAD-dependent epimerase/dehydratase family protein n=1 Tax=Dactylosporangium sp. CA-139114 TaxID=3239931 RepID=UPI003D9812D2